METGSSEKPVVVECRTQCCPLRRRSGGALEPASELGVRDQDVACDLYRSGGCVRQPPAFLGRHTARSDHRADSCEERNPEPGRSDESLSANESASPQASDEAETGAAYPNELAGVAPRAE